MSLFLLKRLAIFAATLAGASVVVFLLLEVLPGDAAQTILGSTATPEAVAALRHKLGLDQPAAARYLAWVGGMMRGEFGTSYAYGVPAADLLRQSLAVTLPLALIAMALNTALGLAAGVYAASRHNRA
ncbi:MAG TPA: ABC transporter permease, partial [Phenylobacterium sp.]